MARPRKQTADWFPHFAKEGGRTKFILESKFGNDGYAFWFKLLELLCRSEGHSYDCSQKMNMEYLVAVSHVSAEKVKNMLDLLSEIGNIDSELWTQSSIIWCQALVDNISSMYEKRAGSLPVKPHLSEFAERKPNDCAYSEVKNRYSTVQENTEEKSNTPATLLYGKSSRKAKEDNLTGKQRELFTRFWNVWPNKVSMGQAEKTWAKLNPDEQLTNQIVEGVNRSIQYDKRFFNGYTPYPSTWLNAKSWTDKFDQRGEENGFRTSTGFRRSADNC